MGDPLKKPALPLLQDPRDIVNITLQYLHIMFIEMFALASCMTRLHCPDNAIGGWSDQWHEHAQHDTVAKDPIYVRIVAGVINWRHLHLERAYNVGLNVFAVQAVVSHTFELPDLMLRNASQVLRSDTSQTLLHETAHAICHDRWGVDEGHSSRFWEIARELGVTRKSAPETDRLATIRARNARYTYRCLGCAEEWTRRSPFGRARLCASCEGKGRPSRLVLVRRPKRAARLKR